MILLYLLFWLMVMIVPVAVLFALPMWGTVRLRRRGARWLTCLLPLLVPVATLASEAYPMWMVRQIAKEPLSTKAEPEAIASIYARNGYAPDAVRIIVRFPSLQFAEGIVDGGRHGDGSVFKWERMPIGLVRFQGRRTVQQASDCRDDEVSVPVMALQYPHKATWYCTEWTPIDSPKATHRVGFSDRDYKIGPFSVLERRDSVIRRSDKQPVNTLISASMTGGLWWHFTEWLGDVTGISSLGAGNTVSRYSASTAEYLSDTDAEEFLMTGRH